MHDSLPKILAIVRAGRSSIHRSWIYTASKQMDVAISVYDDADFSEDPKKVLHVIPGGKFQGVKALLETYPRLIEEYDYFWMLEEDLYIPYSSISKIRNLLAEFKFPLSAPGLLQTSVFTWPLTLQNERFLFRGAEFVDQMAPIMSRAFLKLCIPHFGQSFSGFGYEWLWSKFLRDMNSYAAVLDSAPIEHSRPLNRGTLYRNRPQTNPEPVEEMKTFLEQYGLEHHTVFRNLFGVTSGDNPRLLFGYDLVEEMLAGYSQLLRYAPNDFLRCMDYLLKQGPIADLGDVAGFTGFASVAELVKAS
jgi:hypothetical protein